MQPNLQLFTLVLFSLLATTHAFSQTLLMQESFETDGEGSRYTSNAFRSDCNDFFERIQDSDIPTNNCVTNPIAGEEGTFFWGGEDTDAASGGEGVITFNPVTVTGYTLDVDVLLAMGRPNEGRCELIDYFILEYRMDGGSWNVFGAMYGDNDLGSTGFGNLREDTDLDGARDPGGQLVNSTTFQNFDFIIPVTGNSCEIRIRVLMDSGTEELLIDNLRLNGTGVSTPPTSVDLDATVFLEGAYNGSGMNTIIFSDIPLTQPYGGATFNNHSGMESASAPSGAVDWVLVELREAASAATANNGSKVGSAAGFLMNDGSIKATNGTSDLTIALSGNTGATFYVVVYHRNHLPIMSATAIAESGGDYTIDFTTSQSQAFGTSPMTQLSPGVFGMIAGDQNGDGDVNGTDLTNWRSQNGGTFSYGSSTADFNLDGQVNAVDRNDFQQPNSGKSSQVPN